MQRESEGPVCSRHTASAHIPRVSFSLSHVFSTNFPIVASEHRGRSPSLQCPTLIEIRKISSAIQTFAVKLYVHTVTKDAHAEKHTHTC